MISTETGARFHWSGACFTGNNIEISTIEIKEYY